MKDKKEMFTLGVLIFVIGMFLGVVFMYQFKQNEYEQKVILQEEVNLLKEIIQEQN